VTFPPIVNVLEPLLTPVPPYVEPITDPFHAPLVIVPTVARLLNDVTAELTSVPDVGNVIEVVPVNVAVNV
jgi:hypothetical protein